jgi:hypothetical protein
MALRSGWQRPGRLMAGDAFARVFYRRVPGDTCLGSSEDRGAGTFAPSVASRAGQSSPAGTRTGRANCR